MKLTLSNSDDTGGTPDPLSNSGSNQLVRDALFIAAGAALYWALATLFTYFSGLNLVRLSPFFVGAAGYFFGFRAGLVASLAAVVVHTVALNRLGFDGPFVIFHVKPVAHIGIILAGPVAGKLRSTIRRLQSQVDHLEESERELREAEQRLQQVLKTIEETIWTCAADRNRMIYMSPAFEAVFGIPRTVAESNPRALLDIVHTEDRARVEEIFESSPEQSRRIEYRIARADGSEGWIQTRLFCVRNEDGTVHRIAGVSRDVTERKNAVLALAASEARYRELVEKRAAADLAGEAIAGHPNEYAQLREPAEARKEKDRGSSRGSGTVLVAVDERSVQHSIDQVLQKNDQRVLLAEDGVTALEEASRCDTIDLLVTDVVLPLLNGRELAAELRLQHPLLKVLYISGYIGRASVSVAELGPNTSFLSKPFSSEALARKLRLLSESPPPVRAIPEQSRPALDSSSL